MNVDQIFSTSSLCSVLQKKCRLLRLPCVLISHFFQETKIHKQNCTVHVIQVRISLLHFTVYTVCCVSVWASDRAWERLGHNDTLQRVTCCRRKKKPSWWKCPCGPYTSNLSISQLPSCWFKPICLQEGSKGSAAQSFWESTWSLLCLPAALTTSSWIINFCGHGGTKGRAGQLWINDISGQLRKASPSQCNQSLLPQQGHINLSGKVICISLKSTLCPPSPSQSVSGWRQGC